MILSDRDIKEFIKLGKIRFEPAIKPDQIGAGSVDLTLSRKFWRFREDIDLIDLATARFEDLMEELDVDEITIPPHGMVVGMTAEKVYIDSDLCGWIEGRSRYARLGIAIHSASGFMHPRSNNHRIHEISYITSHPIKISGGMRIVQLVVELTRSKAEKPYRIYGEVARDQ